MKHSFLYTLFFLGVSLSSFGQCTAGDGCTSINPATLPAWITSAHKICFTTNQTYLHLSYLGAGGVVNICDGAELTITATGILGSGTLNIYGTSKFYGPGAFAEQTGAVNYADCANNNNYYWNGVLQASGNCTSLGGGPLPVKLKDFSAYQTENEEVTIDWVTLTELNNSHFHIERSADLLHWSIVNKTEGNGTSNNIINYNVRDKHPLNGTNYYRLVQYDYDDTKTISHIVPVEFIAKSRRHYVYPNPATDELNVSIDNTQGLNRMQIYDMYGNKVFQTTNFEENTHTLDISTFSKGVYTVRFYYNTELITEKFVKE